MLGSADDGSADALLPVAHATPIAAVQWAKDEHTGRRVPLPETQVTMHLEAGRSGKEGDGVLVQVEMGGAIRRLQYWPDGGSFEVFEDAMEEVSVSVKASVDVGEPPSATHHSFVDAQASFFCANVYARYA